MAVIHHSHNAIVAKLEPNIVLKYSRYAWWDYPHDAEHEPVIREAKDSLLIEERILLALGSHPRIIEFLGHYHPQGLKFIEADKGDLQAYINKSFSAITLEDQVRWILQASEAIAYIHSKGIIHSDLRPENFLLFSRPDGRMDLRLCDFGGSKYGDLYGGNLPDAGFFDPRHGLTPTPATDIFSLGSVFFTITYGHWPHWDNEEPPLYQVKVDDLFSRGEFPPVDHITGPIINSCWKGKYATANLLLEDCRNLCAGFQ
ncbi:hypothetical protein FZEAL_7765 [Fusarium zealandicum]|uniref:EKC/KEOPS complex subunit BUD32 n=1 Tax=Fusarium zealandicum TaxID=1053134 RepID=A0A8H4XII8_9HYPO|nr:hypothetical protein FZEAL_7765 [Fusarium zealandicum]